MHKLKLVPESKQREVQHALEVEQHKLEILQMQLQETEKEYEAKCEALREEANNWAKESTSLQEQLNSAKQLNEVLRKSKEGMQAVVTSKENELTQCRAILEKAQAEIENLHNDIKSLKSIIIQRENETKEAQKALDSREAYILELSTQVDEWRSRAAIFDKERTYWNKCISEHCDSRIEELTTQSNTIQSKLDNNGGAQTEEQPEDNSIDQSQIEIIKAQIQELIQLKDILNAPPPADVLGSSIPVDVKEMVARIEGKQPTGNKAVQGITKSWKKTTQQLGQLTKDSLAAVGNATKNTSKNVDSFKRETLTDSDTVVKSSGVRSNTPPLPQEPSSPTEASSSGLPATISTHNSNTSSPNAPTNSLPTNTSSAGVLVGEWKAKTAGTFKWLKKAAAATLPADSIISVNGRSLIIREILNESANSIVYRVKDKQSNLRMVLRRELVQDPRRLISLQQSAQSWKGLKHPFIIEMHELETLSDPNGVKEVTMVMEYGNSTLAQLIVKHTLLHRLVGEPESLRLFHNIVEAVSYLHGQCPPIAHRSISADGILLVGEVKVGETKNCVAKLAQLEGCCQTGYRPTAAESKGIKEEILRSVGHKTQWRAPEMVEVREGVVINEKVDIWSLGCLLYYFVYCQHPNLTDSWTFNFPSQPSISPRTQTLIKECMNIDSNTRPDIWTLTDKLCKIRGVPNNCIKPTTIINQPMTTGPMN